MPTKRTTKVVKVPPQYIFTSGYVATEGALLNHPSYLYSTVVPYVQFLLSAVVRSTRTSTMVLLVELVQENQRDILRIQVLYRVLE
jgi:hypothetical protein